MGLRKVTLYLTPFVVLALLAWVCRVLARRAWDRMPLEKTPSPYDRSQRRNRAGAAVWYEGRPHVGRVLFARRRTISRTEDK
jgi:hypothetical protein